MSGEHPFAQYVRILGRGRNLSGTLSLDQAHAAMKMIFAGEVDPVQLGAFFMLIRVREETAEEAAGFVRAARDSIVLPPDVPGVQLDWPSYAGKRRHLPWFVLSALLLAGHGIPTLMHGIERRGDGRIYAAQALQALGIAPATSLDEACAAIRRHNFAFIALRNFCPVLDDAIGLRRLLGLRSPANTVARMLNPLRAAVQLHGIFHAGYRDIHQGAALLLGDPGVVVLKGEGGEAERNPDKTCQVTNIRSGVVEDDTWPAQSSVPYLKEEVMDAGLLPRVWRGELEHPYGEAAVIGTAAIALNALGRAATTLEAEERAANLWRARPKTWPGAARP